MFAAEGQGFLFCPVQVCDAFRPESTAVLALAPEHRFEEVCRNLVVLLVGQLGHLGDRPCPHQCEECLLSLRNLFEVTGGDFDKSLSQQLTDACADDRIGKHPLFRHLQCFFLVHVHLALLVRKRIRRRDSRESQTNVKNCSNG